MAVFLVVLVGSFLFVISSAQPAPADSTSQKGLKCLQCESHVSGSESLSCPVFGFVFPDQVTQVNCSFGACYTILDTVDGVQVAHRGCTNDVSDMPYSLPEEGCYSWKGYDICVCYESDCNVLPADYSSGTSFDAHLKKKQNPKERGSVSCFQCINYDDKGNNYPQCPKQDFVDPYKVFSDQCNSTCFTRSYSDDEKKVARGCTDSQWGLPEPLPPDGCYNWDGAVWCVCSADGCNGRPLETDGLNRCYECINYDAKGNYYKQCPKTSRVRNAYLRVCNQTCFTRSFDYNHDMVARGCTDTQWGLPDPLPPDGCYKWYSEVWCVCSGTRCNGFPIGDPQDIEFDAHIKKDKNQANSVFKSIVYTIISFLHITILLSFF